MKSARDRLERSIRKESETRFNATVSDMEVSYTKLEHEYEQFRQEAKVFGIDKDDPRYDSLLKGRQFEIFVARSLVTGGAFKILEWTPDKGFDDGIAVEANTNPDLVVQSVSDEVFALECKYRSSTFKVKGQKKSLISWSYPAQIRRYEKFQSERQLVVFLAIGVGGLAHSPDKNYLIPINQLTKKSFLTEKFKKGQTAVGLVELYSDYLRDGDYGAGLKARK